MATVKAENSKPGEIVNETAMEAWESALEDLGEESSAGLDTVDAADSEDPSDEGIEDELDGAEDGDPETEEAEAEAEAEAEVEAEGAGGPKLKIEVTDEKGKRTVEFDPSDKAAVTRAVQQAAGARKLYPLYNQRGETIKQQEAALADLTPKAANFDKLEELYAREGIDGLVRKLEGKGLDDFVREAQAFKEQYAKWTPAERAAYDAKQVRDRAARDVAAAHAERDSVRSQAAAAAEAAALQQLESHAHSAFKRYSFDGKLGDKTQEIRMDKVLWNNISAELSSLEAAGTKLTRDVVRRVAADTAAALGSTVKKAVDKQVSSSLTKKKEAATKKAQTRMVRSDARAERNSGATPDFDINSTTDIANLMVGALGKKRR